MHGDAYLLPLVSSEHVRFGDISATMESSISCYGRDASRSCATGAPQRFVLPTNTKEQQTHGQQDRLNLCLPMLHPHLLC